MPYTVQMSCGCTLEGVEDAGRAICVVHPQAKPERRQHYTASGSGPEEALIRGSWVNLADHARFEAGIMGGIGQRRPGGTGSLIPPKRQSLTVEQLMDQLPTDERRQILQDFTREWLGKRAPKPTPAVSPGRFTTLEEDEDDGV